MNKAGTTFFVVVAALATRYLLWPQSLFLSEKPTVSSILKDIDAPDALRERTYDFGDPQIIKVDEGVYLANDYGLSNVIMLVGPEGVIIVDTTENLDLAHKIAADFKKITDKPIKAIIYTHHHTDHISGAQAFIEDPANPPDIWAHPLLAREVARIQKKAPIHMHRAMFQFGYHLEDFLINIGLAKKIVIDFERTGPAAPSRWMEGKLQEVSIAGLNLTLMHVPGETSDEVAIWYPEKRILFSADDLYKGFPNLAAIRGTTPRDANDWIDSLNLMSKLNARILVGGHGRPLIGERNIKDHLTVYRAGMQFIHDQTVRFMNKGLHPDEIAKKLHLPPELARHPFLHELYGTFPWAVRGIFLLYLGWFSGSIEDLYPLTPSERAVRMMRLVGKRQMLRAATDALEEGDYQWALELASHVHTHDEKNNADAIEVRRRAISALAEKQTTPLGRNYYLTALLEDAKLLKELPLKNFTLEATVSNVFEAMRCRLKSEDVSGLDTVGCFYFTDLNRKFGLHIHHSILDVMEGDALIPRCDFTVETKQRVWKEILVGFRSPIEAHRTGQLKIDAGFLAFKTFMDYFDKD